MLVGLLLLAVVCQVDGRLEQVVSMFRHGSRYYLHHYYDANDTLWGELTSVGMRTHQNLGKAIRNDYIANLGFLSDTYSPEQIQVYSTNVNRTHQSVISQLYGLYPLGKGSLLPKVDQKYHIPPYKLSTDSTDDKFALPEGYQQIPVLQDENVLPLGCPLAASLMDQNERMQIQTVKEMNLTYYPFMKKMGKMFNFTTLNFSAMVGLYDTLAVDDSIGNPLPDDFTREDYLNLQHLTNWYSLLRLNFNLSKAFNTNVLKRVIRDFEQRISNSQKMDLKWTFLSAHDTNVFAMANDLNISSAACIQQLYRKGKTEALNCMPGPEYAANIIFELHSQKEEYYVRVRYNGESMNLCGRREKQCKFEEWKKRAEEVIIPNAKEVCFGRSDQRSGSRFDGSDIYDGI